MVLKLQGTLAAVRPEAHHNVGSQEAENLIFLGEFRSVPYPTMPGFQGLAVGRLSVNLCQADAAEWFRRIVHGCPSFL